MSTQGSERRQQPRWALPAQVDCRVELHARVRLVDISATGALFAADLPLQVGTVAHLRAGVGPGFTPDVQIKRVTTTGQRPTLAMGAIFTGMDERSRRSLEEFLKKANA